MMKRKLSVLLTLCLSVLCLLSVSLTAFASEMPEETTHTETQPEETEPVYYDVIIAEDGTQSIVVGNQEWSLELEEEQLGKVVNVTSYLHLRTGPGMEYEIIGHLMPDTEVDVIEEKDGWYKVSIPEQTGYVCGDYLKVTTTVKDATDYEELLKEILEFISKENAANPPAEGSNGNPDNALTPDGNLTLVDDVGTQTQAGKQFITVESKNGNTFYLIIDRDDEGKETVHFLNLVDESDLLALMEDGNTNTPVCTCTDKCVVGTINTGCEICRSNMSECSGKEPVEPTTEPTEDTDNDPDKETDSGSAGAIVVVLLLMLGGGGALYWFKFRNKKPDTKGDNFLDDYDYGEDEEDEEYEYETEENDTAEEEQN